MTAHAKLSPSSASGWMTCPDYVNANAGLPDDTSEAAAEGTMAHEISDLCLTMGFEPWDFIDQTFKVEGFTFTWTDDDADLLAPGIEYTRAFGGVFHGEHRVDLSFWLGEGQFGTLDRGIILPDEIVIIDLKWGRGIPVSPVRNKQLRIYALGFWHRYCRDTHGPETRVRIIIDQPRCAGGGGEWVTTVAELLEFGEEARAAAERTRMPNPPRVASAEGCMWCRAKNYAPGCKVYEEFNLALVSSKFDDLDDDEPPALPYASEITPERRAFILRHRSMFEDWLERLDGQALDDALAGRDCGGLKAVEGRKSPDKWADPVKADEALQPIFGEARFTKKLITPTQAGKAAKKKGVSLDEELIVRGTKKPILVPMEDERPPVLTAQQKFDEEGDDE